MGWKLSLEKRWKIMLSQPVLLLVKKEPQMSLGSSLLYCVKPMLEGGAFARGTPFQLWLWKPSSQNPLSRSVIRVQNNVFLLFRSLFAAFSNWFQINDRSFTFKRNRAASKWSGGMNGNLLQNRAGFATVPNLAKRVHPPLKSQREESCTFPSLFTETPQRLPPLSLSFQTQSLGLKRFLINSKYCQFGNQQAFSSTGLREVARTGLPARCPARVSAPRHLRHSFSHKFVVEN